MKVATKPKLPAKRSAAARATREERELRWEWDGLTTDFL
jgi:hypothetical protein